MDWTAALTLAFSGVAAATGLLTFGNEVSKRRAERKARAEAEARDWSLRAMPMSEAGLWKLRIRYGAAQERPVAVRALKVVAPRGAEIATFVEEGGTPYVKGKDVPDADGWRLTIRTDKDLSPGYLFAGMQNIRTMDHADYEVLGRVPPAAASRDGRTRFRISLTIEDRSALRRQSSFIVTSQEIAWTAKSADKAT